MDVKNKDAGTITAPTEPASAEPTSWTADVLITLSPDKRIKFAVTIGSAKYDFQISPEDSYKLIASYLMRNYSTEDMIMIMGAVIQAKGEM